MIFKLGWKDFKRTKIINCIIIFLLVVVFLLAISTVSAIESKVRKYTVLSQALDEKGVYLQSEYLQRDIDGDVALLKDYKELKEFLPKVDKVFAVEELWTSYIADSDKAVRVWCYSNEVIDACVPIMESGRWFNDSDTYAPILKAVVTHNDGSFKTGDILTLETDISDAKVQIEIIGVIEDNESLFYPNDIGRYGDYRDCYYTYNYEAEEGVVWFFLSDEQILNGEKDGLFSELNYRLAIKKGDIKHGFQKQMKGGTLLTYSDDVSQEEIDRDMDKLSVISGIYRRYQLQDLKSNSWDYILQELHMYFPIFVCIVIFIVIAAISANVITVKKQLKNYAIYYMCGLTWKKCSKISFCVACITSVVAFLMMVFCIVFLGMMGVETDIYLHLGVGQIIVCATIMIGYVLAAWLIPLNIVKDTSAKEIISKYH